MATTTNYTQMAYIKEAEDGVTPDSPNFRLLPTTGGSPVSNITTATSEVIRADRQTDDLTVVDSSISGDMNYELSYKPYKPFMISLMQSTEGGAISVSGITATDVSFNTLSLAGLEGQVQNGDVFKLKSSTNPEINGAYSCIDNSGTDEITIYPSLPDFAGSIADITIDTTSTIVNGAGIVDSYTFRKTAQSDANTYRWYYQGCKINTMNFNFTTGSILNGSMGVLGLREIAQDTALVGEVDPDLPVEEYTIMNSVTSVGAIYIEGGSEEVGTCTFSTLDLVIDNQITEAKSVGVLGACATASFSLQVTGSVEVYFKNLDMYNKFLNAEQFAVTLTLTDGILDDTEANGGLGEVIGINLPKCKFESLDTPISGKDAFLMQSGSIRALRHDDDDYMVKFSFVD